MTDELLDTMRDEDIILPRKPLLKRVANRFHAKKRPQEPTDLEVEVNSSFYILNFLRLDQWGFNYAPSLDAFIFRSLFRLYCSYPKYYRINYLPSLS